MKVFHSRRLGKKIMSNFKLTEFESLEGFYWHPLVEYIYIYFNCSCNIYVFANKGFEIEILYVYVYHYIEYLAHFFNVQSFKQNKNNTDTSILKLFTDRFNKSYRTLCTNTILSLLLRCFHIDGQ